MMWMTTVSGIRFEYLNPTPEMVDIRDIVHVLRRIPRFMGHTRELLTVAVHSCNVSKHSGKKYALEGLLHDAAEAYIGDICTPLKRLLGDKIKVIEERINLAIAAKFKLIYPWPEQVVTADRRVLITEAKILGVPTAGWSIKGRGYNDYSMRDNFAGLYYRLYR